MVSAKSGGLGSIPARRHVTPSAPAIASGVEEDARAARIGATPHAKQLALHQRVGGRLDYGDHEAREGVTHRHERAGKRSVLAPFHSPRTRAPPEDPIDLLQGIRPDLLGMLATFGEGAKGGSDAPGIHQRRRSAGRLLLRPTTDSGGAFGIEYTGGVQPAHQPLEVAQHVHADAPPHIVGIHIIEPEPFANKDERPTRGGAPLSRRRMGDWRVDVQERALGVSHL